MHCEKGKKKKSNAVDYTTIYWDIHWSISKTLQDPVSRLLRMSRHPFQSDNIYFLRDSSHSHISLQLVGFVCSLWFFFSLLLNSTVTNKPVPWQTSQEENLRFVPVSCPQLPGSVHTASWAWPGTWAQAPDPISTMCCLSPKWGTPKQIYDGDRTSTIRPLLYKK